MCVSDRQLQSFVLGQFKQSKHSKEAAAVSMLLAARKITSMAPDTAGHTGARLLTFLAKAFNRLGRMTSSPEIAEICNEEKTICLTHAAFRLNTVSRQSGYYSPFKK